MFAPSRVLLIDTVRAAAIGTGAATGVLLVADVGAQLTEVAVLVDGRVVAARRSEMGTHDGPPGRAPRLLAGVVTRLVADIGRNPHMRRLTAAALARGVIVVGDGATTPELTVRLAANLRVPVLTGRLTATRRAWRRGPGGHGGLPTSRHHSRLMPTIRTPDAVTSVHPNGAPCTARAVIRAPSPNRGKDQ